MMIKINQLPGTHFVKLMIIKTIILVNCKAVKIQIDFNLKRVEKVPDTKIPKQKDP